jgi:glycosyltransferase involved in cell wall biosynthesis
MSSSPALRVAVDAHNISHDTYGIARYVNPILRDWLKNDMIELTLMTRSFLAWRNRAEYSRLLGRGKFTLSRRLPGVADVIWHPWNGAFVLGTRPHVVTIHDVSAFAFPSLDERRRQAEQRPYLRAAEHARRIITPSEFMAAQIHSRLGVARERISVVPLAPDAEFTRPEHVGMPPEPHEIYFERTLSGRPYILHVGDVQDSKRNFPTLYDAWRRQFPDRKVALVTTQSVSSMFEGVISLEAPVDTTLARLYRKALCVAIPTLYSGFGLTLIEAMSCGVPVIASHTGALPEVGANAPYWIHRPADVTEWMTALARMAQEEDLRTTLKNLGQKRAADFSLQRTSHGTFTVLKDVARLAIAEVA